MVLDSQHIPTQHQAALIANNTQDTMAWLLEEGRCTADGGVALQMEEDVLTHDELKLLLVTAETELRALGIGRPTRVMTALPDGPLAACVLLALTRSAICAPVNPDLRAAELLSLIPELRVQALVAHGPCAEEARRTAAALGLPILEVDWAGKQLSWSGPALEQSPAPNVAAQPDDTALVLLTSGSSARPKRVPLTHRQLTLSARRMAESISLTPQDCCLNLMPMFHVGAVVDLMLAPFSVGGSVVRPETMSVPAFFEALDRWKPTWFQGVPTLLHELTVHAVRDQSRRQRATSLRLVRSVSSPLPPEWCREIELALGAPVIEIYGMTETAGVITSNPLPPALLKVGSVGRPTGLEVIVRDAAGHGVGCRVRGEIAVRGPGVMRGYESGADVRSECDWLPTGDEGYFDEDNYLFITGRIGDQINRGGEKISPREIDEVLAQHPAIQDAAAYAWPHPQLGQEVAAAVVAKPGRELELTLASLTAHVSAQLAYFKVPKTYHLVPALPRGPGGKLRRRMLPELVRDLAPLAGNDQPDFAAPQTPRERQVAAWWETELRVSQVGRQADFFELGGDSLAAASFTVGVEKALGVKIRPAALFDHPTVAAFAAFLDEMPMTQRDPDISTSPLNPDFLQRSLAAMSVWPGERRDEFALVVGRRTDGPGVPVF